MNDLELTQPLPDGEAVRLAAQRYVVLRHTQDGGARDAADHLGTAEVMQAWFRAFGVIL